MMTDTLPTVELLSLENKQGRYWMGLAIERNGTRVTVAQEVDADTCNNLIALEPFTADKVRLSLHTGWDPFRQSHYSMLVKSCRLLNETRYFTCSASYAALLDAWRAEARADDSAIFAAKTAHAGGTAHAGDAIPAGDTVRTGERQAPLTRAASGAETVAAVGDFVGAGEAMTGRGETLPRGGRPFEADSLSRSGPGAGMGVTVGRLPRSSGFLLASCRLLLLACMFFFVWFEFESRLFNGTDEATHEQEMTGTVAYASEASFYIPIPSLPWSLPPGPGMHEAAYAERGGSMTGGVGPPRTAATVGEPQQIRRFVGLPALSADTRIGSASGLIAGALGTSFGHDATQEGTAAAAFGDAEGAAADSGDENGQSAYDIVELERGVPYYSLPSGYVALTFDDGPSEYTRRIVDLLKEHDAAGTFLFVGMQAVRYPEEAEYAAESGMGIGNHSWDHSDLTLQERSEQADNIGRTNEWLESLIGSPVSIFRPPYGATNDELAATLSDMGMKPLMWNRDPEDWKAQSSQDIVRYFKILDPSGGIYVLHEKKSTLEALPEIIDYLKEQELSFVTFR